ncbi:L-arginine-specific L-amino acid ligase [termite gut metagenome]|uniref:L-arginine-specific L-amino acid ligase n=1 Tax=termite gut metagenome TaxID=433724 RepID=A0A5J4RWK4_9ZZZZ
MPKKILLLGGTHFQIPSVKTAKRMGYYTITCDYSPNNPGHKFADEYHNVSTTDKEAVLQLAQKLKIDGIVCYASDPAALTAAYVAEKMELPGQPYKSVEILSNKDLFRDFLSKNGFHVPKAIGFTSIEDGEKAWDSFKKPVMVKPVDSSGSKGVSKVEKLEDLESKIAYALTFSRNKRFIIEEYVEKFGYQIAGDGFSVNGRLVFRCFANDHFNLSSGNPFVPIAASWPYNMPKYIHDKIHTEVQRLFDLLEMSTGAYNFDIRIDKDENVYLMEVAPRNGGNLIDQVIHYATGVDLVEYTINAALGEDCSNLKMIEPDGFWSCYVVHSKVAGILEKVEFSDDFRNNNIIEFEMLFHPGDRVDAFNGSNGTLGTMILKFASETEMLEKMDHMDNYVRVITKKLV